MLVDLEKVRSELIGQIYVAATDPDVWLEFLSNLANILRSNVRRMSVARDPALGEVPTGLQKHLVDPGEVFSYAIGISRQSTTAYLSDWIRKENLTAKAIALSRTEDKRVIVRQKLADDLTFERSDFYQHFVRKLDYLPTLGCIGFSAARTKFYTLSVNRQKREGPFGTWEEDLLRSLAPHLDRALAIHDRLNTLRLTETAHSTALASTGKACFVVSPTMQILWMDPVAEKLVRSSNVLRTTEGRLAALDETANSKLRNAIAAFSSADGAANERSGAPVSGIRLSGPDRSEWLKLSICNKPAGFGKVRLGGTLILVEDLRQSLASFTSDLLQRWRLTPAESRVALLLGEGFTPREIAGRLQRSVGTIRNQLKSILSKSQCRRQAELVSKLVVRSRGE